MMPNNTPFSNLSPDLILNAIEALNLPVSGSISALNSFENRVYQIGIDDAEPLIAKFYRPGRWSDDAILEEHQFTLELSTLDIPVVAPLIIKDKTLHFYQGFRFALFPRRGGRAFEVDNMIQLEQMGRFIARIHAAGRCSTFTHRLRIDAKTYGRDPYEYLQNHAFFPNDIQKNLSMTMDTAIQLIEEHLESLSDIPYLRIHGDFHAGNLLWNNGTLHIVDLDDCLMGPAVQDIWMMLSGSLHENKVQLKHILDGYYEFDDFNLRELRLIEPLRTLRMIHYAGWLAKRWEDPAFPISFPWFNTPRYWENLLVNLREQIELLQEPYDAERLP